MLIKRIQFLTFTLLLVSVFFIPTRVATAKLKATLEGHTDNVWSVAFRPNSNMLASASWDQTVRLWNVDAGRLLHTLTEHTDTVMSVAFSPDGQTLVSSSWDGTIRLWNPNNGKLKRTLTGHAGGVGSIAFSPDGQTLASGSADRTVRLWNTKTWKLKSTLRGHTHVVDSVVFSRDGQTLASGSRDQTIRLWNPNTGKHIKTLREHTGDIVRMTFSPDGTTLASGSLDGTVRLWDPNTGNLKRTLAVGTGRTNPVAFSPDGATLLIGGRGISTWDTETGEYKIPLVEDIGTALSVVFSPDGQMVASGSRDNKVHLWDFARYVPDVPFTDNPFDITNIPEPVPPPAAVRDFFDLEPFYQQWINVDGFPILASAKVSPYAVKEVAWLIHQITRHSPAALQAMVENKVRFSIIGHNERTTEIPEHRRFSPEPHFFFDVRLRGGYCPRCKTVSASEATALDERWYSVTIHEFAHAFHEAGLNTIDPTFDDRLRTTYNAAMARGLWQNTYASTNFSEYWAQGVGTWFHANPEFQSATTREALKNYDPGLASLLSDIFGDGAWRYTLPASRTHLPHLQGFNPQEAPRLEHPPELLETYRQFTSNPDNDGGGEWVNLEPYPPNQLQSLNRSRTIGDLTISVYFMNHTGATVQVYRVNSDGKEVDPRNFIPGNFNELRAPIGELLLVKDDTAKNIAVFFVDKITRGSIVRIFVGNPEPIPITGPEIAIEKPPVVKVPGTGTEFVIEKPPELTRNNFTIGPGEFAILVHDGQQAIIKQANFKTYDSYFTLPKSASDVDIPNLAQFFQNGGRIELISHITANPLPRHSSEAEFGDIVISEIMWGLDDTSPAKQYIELYNASAHAYSFAAADVSLRFSTVAEEPLPDGAFPPLHNPDVRFKVIDRVSNNGWKVPGRSGNTSESKPLISMYRTIDYTTEDMPDGTLVSSWKASTGRVNLSTPNYGTPGAKHLLPAPVVLVEASQRPPMYWMDAEAGTLHRLIDAKVEDLLPNVQNATSLAVDVAGGKLYWAEKTSDRTGKIKRANLDGSDVKLVKDLTGVPLDIALDTVGRKLYLTNAYGKVQRLNLDGSNFQSNLITDLQNPNHLALDVARGKVYWTEQTGKTTGTLRRVNLDGTDIQLVKELTSAPHGIAVDAVNQKLYLTNSWGKVQRLNVDGSNFQSNLITGLDAPKEVSVDMVGRKIYWTEQDGIWRADLNGENIEDVVTGLGAPTGIILGTVPAVAPAAPAIANIPPNATVLLANYPNPFNPETWIPYQLSEPAEVALHIYAVDGKLIRTLVLGHQPAGVYQSRARAAYWDGRNTVGEPVASGIYFYTLTVGDFTATRKMLIRK